MAKVIRTDDLIVFAVLIGLLALNMAQARWLDLGVVSRVVTIALAAGQALVLLWYFLELRSATLLIRLVAAAGFFWLAVLFGLGLNDWLTR
ncbi:MAG: cytochrome C oxidase subunit IV family protein [Tabrizicola sp.]|nr:cytochrome C oxidase subunit IV family protein [Tabrizicola sp.]